MYANQRLYLTVDSDTTIEQAIEQAHRKYVFLERLERAGKMCLENKDLYIFNAVDQDSKHHVLTIAQNK